jgi:hypothetical protein
MRFSVLVILIVLVAALTFGCICCPTKQAVAPTPIIAHISIKPTVAPTVTVEPVTSHIFMPEQTTNGRHYASPTPRPTIGNGSKHGGLSQGELGRQ